MTVETLTTALVAASGRPASDPAVQAARSAALAVKAAGASDLEIHLRAWRQAVARLAGGEGAQTVDDLMARALGLPAIPGLAAGLGDAVVAGDARLLAGRDVGGALGPLTIDAHLPAVTVGAGRTSLVVGLAPPAGYGARIDTGPLTASGGAGRDEVGISGHLAATVGSISAGAFARLMTDPEPGVAAILGARFTPGIQVGFGFELSTLGGAVAVGRGLDVEELRGALASGTALGLFFPADPADRASRLPLLAGAFPNRPGTTVAGPSAELTWLQVAGTSFLRLSLVALLELPRGRLVVLGRAVVEVPPVLSFRLDVLGEIDPPHGVVALDLAIVEGRVLGIFRAAGTMALRVRTADPPHALVTLGGFFPGYRPDVPGLPEQRRISLGPDLPLPLTIRFEGYLAVTDGTFQAGASIEIRFSLGITVRGHISFDVIAHLDPFHVHARVEGGVEVRALGVTLGGVRFRGTVDGPGPLVLAGEVSVRVLGVKAGWNDRFVLERSSRRQPPPVHDLVGLVTTGKQRPPGDVRDAVELPPSALRATEAADPLVAVEPPTRDDDERAVLPAYGTLVWTQTVAPFDTPLARVGGRRLQGVEQLRLVTSTGVTAGPTEQFSPASFVDADQATLLALPAYERLASGLEVRPGTASGRPQAAAIGYLEIYKGEDVDPVAGAGSLADPAALALLDKVWASPASTVGEPRLHVHAEHWEVRTPGHRPRAHPSRSAAVLRAPGQRDPDATGLPALPRPVATATATPAVPVADLADLWTP